MGMVVFTGFVVIIGMKGLSPFTLYKGLIPDPLWGRGIRPGSFSVGTRDDGVVGVM
jgi:hypothetical protein